MFLLNKKFSGNLYFYCLEQSKETVIIKKPELPSIHRIHAFLYCWTDFIKMQVGYSQKSMCFCQRWSQSYANLPRQQIQKGLWLANGEKGHVMIRWTNILQLTDAGMFSSHFTPRDTLADFLSTDWRSPVNHILLNVSWGLACDIQSIAKLQGIWQNGEKAFLFFLWLLSFWRACVSYWTYDPDICFSFYSVFTLPYYNSSRSNSSPSPWCPRHISEFPPNLFSQAL